MDIYNKVRDKILDVVIRNYNEIDTQTLNLITCEQPKNLKFGDLSTNVLMIIKNKIIGFTILLPLIFFFLILLCF